MRQPHDLLAEIRCRFRWRDQRVAEHVIDKIRAGRARIGQPAHLHRRRPSRHHLQPRVAGKAHHVDEDVDTIGGDATGQIVGPHRLHVDEVFALPLDPPAVAAAVVGAERICEDFELLPVVQGKHPLREMAHRMIIKISRQVADPQPARPSRLPLPLDGQLLPQRLLFHGVQLRLCPGDRQLPGCRPRKHDCIKRRDTGRLAAGQPRIDRSSKRLEAGLAV